MTDTIHLDRLERIAYEIEVVGVTPLIVHRFSEKAKTAIVDKNMGKTAKVREAKDPVQEYHDSRYILDDERDGFPAVGFKAAIVGSARLFPSVTMTSLKQIVSVRGEGSTQLVPIDGERDMREDYVRFGQGSTDVRFRAQYWPWRATLHVETIEGQLTRETVVALVDAGGHGGVGEWRPSAPKSHTGDYGRFEVA